MQTTAFAAAPLPAIVHVRNSLNSAMPSAPVAQGAHVAPAMPLVSVPHMVHVLRPAPPPTFHAMPTAWLAILILGALVLLMHAGFALVESGLCRAKNAAHTFAMNLAAHPLCTLPFWAFGFALGWGDAARGANGPALRHTLGGAINWLHNGWTIAAGRAGLIGGRGFFLAGVRHDGILLLFFIALLMFQTAVTIPTGALAERWRWNNFSWYCVWVAIPFAIFASFTWGGGWLAQLAMGHGFVDFGGSGVVHAFGGLVALAGAMLLGPRLGKFMQGKPQALPGHHLPMVMAGAMLFSVGALAMNGLWAAFTPDVSLPVIFVNTLLGASAALVAAMLVVRYRFGKPDPSLMCNGLMAGFAALAAPCAFVSPWAAVLIGLIAGTLVVYSIFFFDGVGIDDPVGAISVHGVCGVWGLLALGIFANGRFGAGVQGVAAPVRGLFYGDAAQLGAQAIGAVVLIIVAFGLGYVGFAISSRVLGGRVSRDAELQGLDVPQSGAPAYPDFELKTLHSVSEWRSGTRQF